VLKSQTIPIFLQAATRTWYNDVCSVIWDDILQRSNCKAAVSGSVVRCHLSGDEKVRFATDSHRYSFRVHSNHSFNSNDERRRVRSNQTTSTRTTKTEKHYHCMRSLRAIAHDCLSWHFLRSFSGKTNGRKRLNCDVAVDWRTVLVGSFGFR
jgi:hypothetical protein